MIIARSAARGLSLAVVAALLCSCDFFGPAKQPPLPGERIAVLLHQRTLSPDPGLSDAEIVLPEPLANSEWPQAGGLANHAMHHIEINDTPGLAWQADVGKKASREIRMAGTPVVADGRVFTLDAESRASAFDVTSGKRLWAVALTPKEEDEGHIGGGLAYDQGRLFVTTGFAQVIALKPDSGEILWRQSVGGPMRSAPTARGGRVFAITVDNKLVALNATTGELLWTHAAAAEAASLLGGASPAEDAGVVVAPFSSGELAALRVDNGRVLWSDSLASSRGTDVVSTLSHIRGHPVIDRGRVFAISHGGIMVAIDLRNGQRIWDRDIGGIESPWVAGSYIYLLTADAEIVCLSREDGRIHWVRGLPRFANEKKKEDSIVWTGPILASDRLIIAGSHGEAWSLSPYSGNLLGKVKMPAGVSVPPIIANGSIYFLSDNAKLVAYR